MRMRILIDHLHSCSSCAKGFICIIHLIHIATLYAKWHYYPKFLNEETGVQAAYVTSARSYS